MSIRSGILCTLGVLLLMTGALVGLALAAGSVWADLESIYYGFDKVGDRRLPGLKCPMLMTTGETGHIHVTFRNPFDKPVEMLVRTDLSNPGPAITGRTTVSLAPGEKKLVRWDVTRQNVDLRMFIFAQVASYPVFTFPFRAATCGIVVLPVPGLTGSQALLLLLGVIGLGLAGGLALWHVGSRTRRGTTTEVSYAMGFLAAVVVLAVFFAAISWWAAGGLLVLLGLLLLVVMLRYLATM